MNKIIKTLLNTQDALFLDEATLLFLEDGYLLNSNEKEYLNYIKTSFEESDTFPTELLFLDKYPEYEPFLLGTTELPKSDFRIHVRELIADRQNKRLASEILKCSNDIARGVDIESNLDKIRDLSNSRLDLGEESDDDLDVMNVKSEYESMKQESKGLLTFIPEIDEVIGGMSLGSTTVISAYTSQYKSVLGTNIMYHNSYDLGYNVAMISLEVPKREVLFNILCRHSSLSKFTKYPFICHDKIRQTKLTPDEETFIFDTVLDDLANNSKGCFTILDESDFKTLSFSEITRQLMRVDEYFKKKTGRGIDAVVVDHMHLTKYGEHTRGMSDGAVINTYTSFFRKIAIHFRTEKDGSKRKLSCILLAQCNRKGFEHASKNGGKYNLMALAEANELERAANRILFIYASDNMKEAKEAAVCLPKNRGGRTLPDPVIVYADGETYTFGENADSFNDMLTVDDVSNNFENLDALFNESGDFSW